MARRPLCAYPELLALVAAAERWPLGEPEQCESPAYQQVLMAIRTGRRMDIHQGGVCVWHASVVVERHGGRILGELAASSP